MRFVILHHTGWPGHADHYDLMLQVAEGAGDADPVLRTFGSLDDEFPHEGSRLRQIQDHRRAYLSYEGPLSGGRGQVARVDEGELEFLNPPEFAGGAAGGICFKAGGARFQGVFRLQAEGENVYLESGF